MRSAGYMVTREQMDVWAEKRPAYAADSIDAKRCLNKSAVTSNYFVSCTTSGTKMPTFDEMAIIKISKVRVKNNDTYNRDIRVGFKVYGSSDAIAWSSYQTVGAGEELTYYLEGLVVDTSYAVYFQESTSSQNLFAFSNNTFVSAITLGYGFIQSTLFPNSTIGHVGKEIKLYVTSLKINMHMASSNLGLLTMWTTGLEAAGYADQYVSGVTEHTFTDIPFNQTFGLHVSGSRLNTGTYYSLQLSTGSGSLSVMYQDETECEYEFETGSTMVTDFYEVNVLAI